MVMTGVNHGNMAMFKMRQLNSGRQQASCWRLLKGRRPPVDRAIKHKYCSHLALWQMRQLDNIGE
jgi:hypothetical protein